MIAYRGWPACVLLGAMLFPWPASSAEEDQTPVVDSAAEKNPADDSRPAIAAPEPQGMPS